MATPLHDLHHNLVQELSELADSVWRYDKHYTSDARSCSRCQALWEKLTERHSQDVRDLKDEIAAHVKGGDW